MFHDADVVHVYTRAQAIADGILIDVSDTARQAGFTISVVLTQGVWTSCVEWSDADTDAGVPQDEAGRLWDVLFLAAHCARLHRNHPGPRVNFTLHVVPRGSRRARSCVLSLHIGGGDEGEPVITIMLPSED